MAASPRQTNEAQKPTLVFKGTIKKLKSSTMKEVPVSDRTAIVTIDQIIEAPPDLTGYSGQDITVELSGRQKVSVGQQMIFHTTSWMYGNSIAVRSLSEEALKSSHTAMLSAGDDPVEFPLRAHGCGVERQQRGIRGHHASMPLVASKLRMRCAARSGSRSNPARSASRNNSHRCRM